MIILEGPDGSGKTTLQRQLSEWFNLSLGPRACSSTGGPINGLKQWVDRDINEWLEKDPAIYDRYPLISEPIYGPLTRGRMPADWPGPWIRRNLRHMRGLALVIVCLPPLGIVRENIRNESQMDGVLDNIDALWGMYNHFSASYTGKSVFYDYTRDPAHTNIDLLVRVQSHIEHWRKYV